MPTAYAHDRFIPLMELGLPQSYGRLQEVANAQIRARKNLPTPRISRRCLDRFPPFEKVGGRLGCWLSKLEQWRDESCEERRIRG
jgi:hypothetical protein